MHDWFIPYFNQINHALVSLLIDSFIPKVYNEGNFKYLHLDDEIIRQGDEGHFMWVLLKGSARVVINGNPVAVLNDNSAFGEAALKHKVKRNASIIAQEHWEVLILHKDEYDRVISDSDLIK